MKLFRMLAAVSGLLAALVVSAVVFATDVAVVDGRLGLNVIGGQGRGA